MAPTRLREGTAPQGAALGLAVAIRRVSRHYGPIVAVSDVSLDVGEGEFVSLLGPSGSGKTTLLMMLAGFERPQSGSISVGGRDVTHLAPNRRDIAMVFQRYALFPHMTVAENIAFPLRMRKMGRAERDERIARALDMVQLGGYGGRKPAELSGGQQQRVALARAIVFEPPVILMDEPLGALDKKLRQHMQIELKQLQRRLGATVIYVTHDQEEALTMSDRVAVMSQGRMIQVGPPRDLYDNPAHPFVADFLGEMNFLPGTVESARNGLCVVRASGDVVAAREARDPETGSPLHLAPGAKVRVAVRPEAVAVVPDRGGATDPEDGRSSVRGTLIEMVFNGATLLAILERPDGGRMQATLAALDADPSLRVGQPVVASWAARNAVAFEGSGP